METAHFSKYMIVDGKEWYRAWQDIYTKINESKGQHIPNATVLISKSSNIYNVNNANRNELIVSNIVDSMSDSDIMSFLTYQNAGGMNTDFTSVKSALKWDPIYYSRTANASYGIGLAAVILNDEAMGYNSKIIFITDSSVSVDSRFLKLAINNKIPIYFFCIGDFNTAALIGYAQLTGGKVYSAKTAAEINQSCNEIGPKTFVGETDTDGDGFTDIEEMSGLIVSSNCKIVNTDYMKADTDDDGLDDNEEVDVELTKVEIPGKQDNPSTFKYYHHMNSDPSKADTDGDGYCDIQDPDPCFPFSEQEIKYIDFISTADKAELIYAFDLLYQETAVKFPTINNLEKAINVIYLCREYKDCTSPFEISQAFYDAGISSYVTKNTMNDGTIIIQDYNLHLSGSSFKQLVENDMNEWRQSLTIAVSFMIYDVAEQIQKWSFERYSNKYKLSSLAEQNVKDCYASLTSEYTTSKTDCKLLETKNAKTVNEAYKMDFGYDPPYLDGTEVKYIKYETDQRFVRVYSSKGKQVSSWIMKYEDIEGLTAREIKIKYSLPDEPYYITDVRVPSGTEIETGIVNALFGGDSGAQQYNLLGQEKAEWFYNKRKI
ncbi:hypothetical protein NE658_07050 [Ruminococcus bicirculans]|nr:hypothetical protein [Ruminococcus bicirculans (ex Wegman et al. 2014)]